MANNGGARQANAQINEHVEFTVSGFWYRPNFPNLGGNFTRSNATVCPAFGALAERRPHRSFGWARGYRHCCLCCCSCSPPGIILSSRFCFLTDVFACVLCRQVKPEEDLYLSGSENTIRRVTAETNYSCLMLKTQRFSSLFRHYAKYHGLRKEDLEYYFVNLLENEDTPESVQLQRGDTIMVRKRRKHEPPEAAADDEEFIKDMRELLDDEEHMDAVFVLNKDMDCQQEIRAHKSVLTARAEYFKALFRTNASAEKKEGTAFKESEECVIQVEKDFTEQQIRYVLEFIYTNRIQVVRDISTDDLLCLLHLSDKWLLRDLKRLVEHELIRDHMTVNTVARLYGATEDYHASRLSRACIEFIMTNLRQLAGNTAFEEEMKSYPHLCMPVLKAAANLIPDGPALKKQRTDHHGTPSGIGSSPVPDSDT
jgi:speckle-type POZ protein